jgi:hypothetical protein
MTEESEEDYGTLIYIESELRKAEAEAAVAAKDAKKKKTSALQHQLDVMLLQLEQPLRYKE